MNHRASPHRRAGHRGFVSRAAGALCFCAAALAVLLFPQVEAELPFGFAPAQVPSIGETTETEFRSADLCQRLGGSVHPEGAGSICNEVDAHGTFCIIGSADIFPCRGLFKQVILCNAEYNRPALNPFLCGIRCAPDQKARGPNCEIIPDPGEILPLRAVTVFAAEGYAGPAHRADIADNYTLDFSESPSPIGLTLAPVPNDNDYEFTLTPLRATLAATLTALIRRAGYYPDALTLAASFHPVHAPEQKALQAEYNSDFTLTLSLPAPYTENAAVSLRSVAPAEPGFRLLSNTLLARSPARTPAAGDFILNIEMTHPDFLGTLFLPLTARIARRPPPSEDLDLAGRATVTVAYGHTGPIFALTILNPDYDFSGAYDITGDPSQTGLTLSLGANNLTMHFALTAALAEGGTLPPPDGDAIVALSVTARADPNIAEYGIPLRYRITTLAPAPIAAALKRGALAVNEQLFDLAASTYAAGTYINAQFEREGDSDFLNIRPDGAIIAASNLSVSGLYAATILATSPNAQTFIGAARITFSLTYEAPRTVTLTDVLSPRAVTVLAAAGYAGPAHYADISIGYTLSFETRSGVGFTLASRPPNDFEFELSPLLTPIDASLTAQVNCDNCHPATLTLAAAFRPVFAPPQTNLQTTYDSPFTLTLTLPQGFDENPTVSIGAVSPPDENFQIISATLLTHPDNATPNAGEYQIAADMTHPNFLGTLTLSLAATIAQKIPPEALALSLPNQTVTVAYGHIGEAFRQTLAATSILEFGPPAYTGRPVRTGIDVTLDANGATVYFLLTVSLANTQTLPPPDGDAITALYVRRRDDSQNFAEHPIPFLYQIETLNEPPPIGRILKRGTLAVAEQFYNFATPDYANGDYIGAEFSDAQGENGSDFLNVLPTGAVIAAASLSLSGFYAVTVAAQSPAKNFIGAARMTFSLTYEAPRTLTLSDILPVRDATVYAAIGYSGPAYLANVGDELTLNFAERSGPGFTLSARPPNDHEFEISPLLTTLRATLASVLECDNCHPSLVTLAASFIPVLPPEQATLRTTYDSDFAFTLTLPERFAQNPSATVAAVSPPANFRIVSATLLTRSARAGGRNAKRWRIRCQC